MIQSSCFNTCCSNYGNFDIFWSCFPQLFQETMTPMGFRILKLIWFCLSSLVCSLTKIVWLNMLVHLLDQQSRKQPRSLIKVAILCHVDFISRNVSYMCIFYNLGSILVGDKAVLSWKSSIMVTAPYVTRASSDLVLTREYSGFSTRMDKIYFH